ncbi:MAG: thioredoxin fold domain-containing protein [Gammaproteobacteria bacterium]|nr:thioredoxin fold domain-containing protein [Gammaproteobacteria bacterium]
MNAIKVWVVSWLLITSGNAISEEFVKPEAKLAPGMAVPGAIDLPHWFKNSFLDVRDDVVEAEKSGRRLMLYFYQDGCPYCKKLIQTNFAIKNLEDKTRSVLDVVAINMWGDREVVDVDGQRLTEKAYAAKMRVMFTPTLLFFNEKASVMLRINGYYEPKRFNAVLDYVGKKLEQRQEFREYLAQQVKETGTAGLAKEAYFMKPPLQLAQALKNNKPLLVLFEQADCPPCGELHSDVLKRAETKSHLQKFNVAQVDMWANSELIDPQGKKVTMQDWAKVLDIKYAPSIVMFDQNGVEVFRTEAYLKSFHVQSSLDYVASGAYVKEPSFQRFIEARADGLRKRGVTVDLMN